MKAPSSSLKRAFSLIETVIAIGVLAVLLTGFMIVFAPAAAGIKKSISAQEADRLASTLEQELVTLREVKNTDIATGFDKAYKWIEDSMKSTPEVIFVYQYRGDLSQTPRDDGTLKPYENASGGSPGKEYAVVSTVRRRVKTTSGADPYFEEDLKALEGRVYAVKAKQLVFSGGQLVVSTKNVIEDPTPGETLTGTSPPISGKYPEAVIAFAAEFYTVSSSSYAYLKTGGKFDPSKLKNPVFTRNLAVRR
jgi:type II secretory pathway pseudopilin PulG